MRTKKTQSRVLVLGQGVRAMRTVLHVERIRTKEDVQRLVDERIRERDDLEFKRALPPPGTDGNLTIARDLAALTNNGLGTLIYGVAERAGRAHKVHPFDLTGAAERVASIARERVDEALTLADVVDVPTEDDGTGVLVIQVDPAGRAPYFVDGQALGRSGPRNVSLSRAEVGRLFAAGGAGFLEEFGVRTGRPASPVARVERGRSQLGYDSKGRPRTTPWHRLVVENTGDEAAQDVRIELLGEGVPDAHGAEEPIPNLAAGGRVELPLLVHMGTAQRMEVRLTWRDPRGQERNTQQTVTV
jgi:hypothetical protein